MDCPPLTLISQVPCHERHKSHPWTCSRQKFKTAVCTATERVREDENFLTMKTKMRFVEDEIWTRFQQQAPRHQEEP